MGDGSTGKTLGLRGFFYPFRGLRFLLGHSRLLPYVAVPVGINAALYALLLWFVGSRFWGWLEGIIPRGDAWYWAVLFYVFLALFGVALALVVVYTFTLLGGLILAPFNEALSAAVERIYTGLRDDEPFQLGALLKDVRRSLKAELGRFALFAAGFVLLLGLHLLPVVGSLIYGVAMPLFTLFFLGWEYLDHSMERAHFTFRLKRRAAFRNGTALVGFGACSALLLLIPVLSLLAIPVCVVGATLLFCDLESSGRIPARPPRGTAGPHARVPETT